MNEVSCRSMTDNFHSRRAYEHLSRHGHSPERSSITVHRIIDGPLVGNYMVFFKVISRGGVVKPFETNLLIHESAFSSLPLNFLFIGSI